MLEFGDQSPVGVVGGLGGVVGAEEAQVVEGVGVCGVRVAQREVFVGGDVQGLGLGGDGAYDGFEDFGLAGLGPSRAGAPAVLGDVEGHGRGDAGVGQCGTA
jgi:hypothetical protein